MQSKLFSLKIQHIWQSCIMINCSCILDKSAALCWYFPCKNYNCISVHYFPENVSRTCSTIKSLNDDVLKYFLKSVRFLNSIQKLSLSRAEHRRIQLIANQGSHKFVNKYKEIGISIILFLQNNTFLTTLARCCYHWMESTKFHAFPEIRDEQEIFGSPKRIDFARSSENTFHANPSARVAQNPNKIGLALCKIFHDAKLKILRIEK